MTYAPNVKIQQLDISLISFSTEDRRAVSELTVRDIVSSARVIGTLVEPIKVRKARRKSEDRFDLLDGAHRIAAAKELGWDSVPAMVWADIPDAYAKLIEFDANAARNEPDAFERCFTVWQRKKIYDEINPEAKQGIAGALARWDATAPIAVASFAASTAELLGIKERQVYNLVEAVSSYSDEELKALRHAKSRVNIAELKKLAKIREASDRSYVIGQIAAGHAASVGEAIAKLKPETPKADPDDQSLEKLLTAWKRAPMKVKRRFVADCESEIADILNGKPDLKAV